ncbi:MAG: hypothetical protein HC917_01685 [Richelia sp. SM2_1_7]|nr:hypothetical protein [Richelia sp. SM2_1_7]
MDWTTGRRELGVLSFELGVLSFELGVFVETGRIGTSVQELRFVRFY